MHLQENVSQSQYPFAALTAYLSYAVTRVLIAIISATTTASARPATTLWIVLVTPSLIKDSSARLKQPIEEKAYVTLCNNFVEGAIHFAGVYQVGNWERT